MDNAISAASDGDLIYLESGTYSANHSTTTRLTLLGTGLNSTSATTVGSGATFALGGDSIVSQIHLDGTLEVGSRSQISHVNGFDGSITVTGDDVIISMMRSGSVTFNSGTSGGIIDSCSEVSVTDNGTNTQGDIA